MHWFTSDTHFGHANILRLAGRPWDSIQRMNDALVAAINDRVAPTDELWHLGDFSFKMTAQDAADLRARINCKKIHIILGNHDKAWDNPAVAGTFIVEPPIRVLKEDGRKFVLCHYPMVDWQSLGNGSIHLHGHIHASASYNEWNRANGMLRYDVGVDANDFAPVSMEQILTYFEGVDFTPRVTREQWQALTFSQLESPIGMIVDEPASPSPRLIGGTR